MEFANESIDNPGLERLWAFATIKSLQEKQDLLGETDDSRQGITDLALRHGLVTNYTSLIAVRESSFEAAGIDLENSARIIRERDARKVRAQGDIKSARQDVQTPMFTQKRSYPGNGGGGSLGFVLLLALLLLGIVRLGLSVYDRVKGDRKE